MNTPNDNEHIEDVQLAKKAKAVFDDSVDRLDAATLSRLNKGRHEALAALERPKAIIPWMRWVPVTGVAAVALVAVLVMRGPQNIEAPFEPSMATDFEILMDEDSLEMLEDLEFYSWLELAEADAGNNVG